MFCNAISDKYGLPRIVSRLSQMRLKQKMNYFRKKIAPGLRTPKRYKWKTF